MTGTLREGVLEIAALPGRHHYSALAEARIFGEHGETLDVLFGVCYPLVN